MTADRRPAHSLRLLSALAAASLMLPAPCAWADEVRGSVVFDGLASNAWLGDRSGNLDLAMLTGLPVGTRYTQVQATFVAGVVGQSMTTWLTSDYALISSRRVDPACDYRSGTYCIHEVNLYARTTTRVTEQTSDATLAATVGSVGGFDSLRGTVTERSTTDGGQVTDAYVSTGTVIPYSAPWWDMSGNPITTTQARLDQDNWYLTNLVDVVLTSTRSALSVALDLDAATLDSLSASGTFDYGVQSYVPLYRPQVLVSYTALIDTTSAVPEPASAALLLAGLAGVAGLARRRMR